MPQYEEYELTPYDEPCAQVGESDYQKRSRLEFKALSDQLIRQFGDPGSHDVYFKMSSNAHDFGTYWSFKMYFEEWNDYADKVESQWPNNWDDEAKQFLKDNGYYEGPR